MPLLRKPSPDAIQKFLAAQAQLDFSYAAVGTTATTPPPGFVVDHTRAKLGEGECVSRSESRSHALGALSPRLG